MKSNIKAFASVTIHAPASKVWDALTNPAIIKQYFFNTDAKSDWKEGSPITFSGEYQGKSYEDHGTILEVQENRKFRYDYWSSMSGIENRPDNYQEITYDLKEEGDDTVLTIKQANIPDEKTKEHSEQNWNHVLQDLKKLVEKGTGV